MHHIQKPDPKIDKEAILLKSAHGILRIPIESVIFIEKQSGQLFIHTLPKIYEATGTLKDIENKFGSPFFRSHKSFIVNLHKIKAIKDTGDRVYEIIFIDYNKSAWMSRKRYDHYFKLISVN
jgi:two-component system LytT family response regulator